LQRFGHLGPHARNDQPVRTAAIAFFQRLQQSIAKNVAKYLKPGKPLIYITCSAFKAENEDAVDFMVKETGLKLEEMKVLKGYERKADTMFVARLIG
jgi:16S rRNA (cytosine967-C5)-methyltransferase